MPGTLTRFVSVHSTCVVRCSQYEYSWTDRARPAQVKPQPTAAPPVALSAPPRHTPPATRHRCARRLPHLAAGTRRSGPATVVEALRGVLEPPEVTPSARGGGGATTASTPTGENRAGPGKSRAMRDVAWRQLRCAAMMASGCDRVRARRAVAARAPRGGRPGSRRSDRRRCSWRRRRGRRPSTSRRRESIQTPASAKRAPCSVRCVAQIGH